MLSAEIAAVRVRDVRVRVCACACARACVCVGVCLGFDSLAREAAVPAGHRDRNVDFSRPHDPLPSVRQPAHRGRRA